MTADDGLLTPHLRLTRPRLADVPALYTFLGDADAMRHTQADASLAACRRRVAVHERARRRNGAAPWTARLRETGRVIGWGGLYDDPFDPGWGMELAYYLHPDVWGQGLGRELAEAALREADEALRLPRLLAFARPENAASNRLLCRIGFRLIDWLPQMERNLYERLRPA